MLLLEFFSISDAREVGLNGFPSERSPQSLQEESLRLKAPPEEL